LRRPLRSTSTACTTLPSPTPFRSETEHGPQTTQRELERKETAMGSGLARMRAGAAIAGVSATALLMTALPANAATHGKLGDDKTDRKSTRLNSSHVSTAYAGVRWN